MIRIVIFFVSLITTLIALPQTSVSQDNSPAGSGQTDSAPAGPGYGNTPPTAAEIETANKRFARINAGLPPEEESEVDSGATSTPITASASSTKSNVNRSSVTSNAGRSRNTSDASSRMASTSASNQRTGHSVSNSKDSSRAKPFAVSSEGLIYLSLNQPVDAAHPSSASNEITWSQGLQELAAISGLSIDVKNLPNGKFDVARLQGLSPAQARDVLNGMLFSQGLTVIECGQKLTVVKLSEINPSSVPLVSLDELDKCLPNQFVRVEFQLRNVLAGPIALELVPLKSEYGHIGQLEQLSESLSEKRSDPLRRGQKHNENDSPPKGQTPFRTGSKLDDTSGIADVEDNQIQIVDAARFVQSICKLIDRAERIAENSDEERSFSLDFSSTKSIRSQLQRLMELQRPLQSQSTASWSAASPITFRVRMIEDRQENCLLAIALPQQIEAMDAFVKFADVASDPSVHFSHDVRSTRVYPLQSIDPQRLAEVLAGTPDFNSTQKLRVDDKNHSIIVNALWKHHQVIVDLVRKFEPGKRRRETIQFHSISVNRVVDMLQKAFKDKEHMLASPRKSDVQYNAPNSSRHSNEFEVSADSDQNRLLLWCTASERREIHEFLGKIGVWKDESDGWIQSFDPGPDPQQLIGGLMRLRLPVSMSIDASGRIVFCSQDLVQLDEAVKKLSDLTRDQNRDRDFPIKNLSAFWIRMNLEDMFGSVKQDRNAPTSELESELRLELDDDPIANILRVRGATPKQIQSIEWLVAANDVLKF